MSDRFEPGQKYTGLVESAEIVESKGGREGIKLTLISPGIKGKLWFTQWFPTKEEQDGGDVEKAKTMLGRVKDFLRSFGVSETEFRSSSFWTERLNSTLSGAPAKWKTAIAKDKDGNERYNDFGPILEPKNVTGVRAGTPVSQDAPQKIVSLFEFHEVLMEEASTASDAAAAAAAGFEPETTVPENY